MPVYRNDPRMLTRKINPATGDTLLAEYGPPQISPFLEPRVALSPRAAELHRANNVPPPPVVNPNYDWELARAESSRTGGNAHEILRGLQDRPAVLARLQAETGNLESEAEVRRRSLEPLELPGYGQVDPRASAFINNRASEKAQLEAEIAAPYTLGPGQRRMRGSEIIGEGREQELTPYQQEQLRLANERMDQSGSWRTTVDENGNPVQRWFPSGTGGDIPVSPTVDQRNKSAARDRLAPFIQNLKEVSERLITKKLSAEQRVVAATRGLEAALANDPDYRTYQDFRTALAAAMGTAEQGSRISDFDVKGVYAPMIPDVFKDTDDSRTQKWELIEKRFGMNAGGQAGSQGGAIRVISPDGTRGTIPAEDWAEAQREGYRKAD